LHVEQTNITAPRLHSQQMIFNHGITSRCDEHRDPEAAASASRQPKDLCPASRHWDAGKRCPDVVNRPAQFSWHCLQALRHDCYHRTIAVEVVAAVFRPSAFD
jgi:hypothetical protein